tara:strand:- start:2040 stop:3470 length:1431 start_codon:yes stop_codon:yes gene_type:complete
MSQFESIDKVLKEGRLSVQKLRENNNLNEEDKNTNRRKRYNEKEKEQRRIRTQERNLEKLNIKKKFSKNVKNKVNVSGRGGETMTPGGQMGFKFDDTGELEKVTTQPPELKKVKGRYKKKLKTQTPIKTGPLFDQQPRDAKGFKKFTKSDAYYARQKEKTILGRKRYGFIQDKDGKYILNPKSQKRNIEKFARRQTFRQQQASGSNVPIKLTQNQLIKAKRDMLAKYGGTDMKLMPPKQLQKLKTKIASKPPEKTMTYLKPAGSGQPVPFKKPRKIKKVYTPPKPELEKINPRIRKGTTTTTTPIGSQRVIKKVSQKEIEKLTRTVRTPVGSKFGDVLKANQTPIKIPAKEIEKLKVTRGNKLLNKGFKTGTQGLLKPNKFARIMSKIPKAGKIGLALGGAAMVYSALKPKSKPKNPSGGPIAITPSNVAYKDSDIRLRLGGTKKEMPTASNPTANTTRLNSITNQALLAKQNRNS